MYSSRASKEAADTYTASKAGPSTDSTSRSSGYGTAGAPGTAYGNSSQGYSNGPSYSPPVAQAPAPMMMISVWVWLSLIVTMPALIYG